MSVLKDAEEVARETAYQEGFAAGTVAVERALAEVLDSLPAPPIRALICGVVCECGQNNEPLACGWKLGHSGPHSWASLPTFISEAQVQGP